MSDLDRFARFCREVLTTDNNKPMKLEPFQRSALGDYFNGTRETLLLLSKKLGKSSLLAALGLYELCSIPNAEIAIVAASREQAAVLLRQARGYVRRSPRLRERLRVVQREIRHTRLGGEMRILAADSDTLDGWIGDRAFLDELGRWTSDENYQLLRDGIGPRDGRLVAISTAGDSHDSPLGRLRRKAYEQGVKRDPKNPAHRIARATNFTLHEWSLDETDDPDDLRIVKRANPASWMTVAELRKRHDSPGTSPWAWKRFGCGLWEVGSEDGAISSKEWGACARPGQDVPDDAKGVRIGVDLGWRADCTAFVPVWKRGKGKIVVGKPVILTPPADDRSLDAEEVYRTAEMFHERWPDCMFVLDPRADGEQLAQRLDGELRAEVWTHSQAHGPMSQASELLRSLVAEGGLEHPDDPDLNRHVLAAVPRQLPVGWRLTKPKRKRLPIDGAVALAMALRVLTAAGTAAPSSSEAWVPDRTPVFT